MHLHIRSIIRVSFFIVFFLAIAFCKPIYATTYDLIAPSGQLTRGQDVQFAVTIDTESTTLKTALMGMTYDTRYLQYVSTTPGDAMTTVTTETQAGTATEGRLILNGANSAGYSGSGTFAFITFKLIAQSAGSTQLCSIFQPTTPTSPPGVPTSPPGVPTSPPGVPTSPPGVPTTPQTVTSVISQIPKLGDASSVNTTAIFAVILSFIALSTFVTNRRSAFKKLNKHREKK
ncbi:MAG: cohesin domain-containing protein [Candidatus Roizmanbacteria bacterium]